MSHAQVSSSDSACWPAEDSAAAQSVVSKFGLSASGGQRSSAAAQSVAALGRRRGEDNISSYNDKRARR